MGDRLILRPGKTRYLRWALTSRVAAGIESGSPVVWLSALDSQLHRSGLVPNQTVQASREIRAEFFGSTAGHFFEPTRAPKHE